MATAAIYWLEIGAVGMANLTVTESSDRLEASASVSPAAPAAQARLTWLEVGAAPSPPGSVALIKEQDDSLIATATVGGITPVARLTWLQISPDGRIGQVIAKDSDDSLTARAYAADPRVAGVWTPALLERWWLLDAPALNPTGDALIAEQNDRLVATAMVSRMAAALVAESDDRLVATATVSAPVVRHGILRDLVEEFYAQRAESGLPLSPVVVLTAGIQATRFYAGWATLTDTTAQAGVFSITGDTAITPGEWAIIDPLFRLYVEREQALVTEASRVAGVEMYGRSSAEVAADIKIMQDEMPQKAYVEEAWTVGGFGSCPATPEPPCSVFPAVF